MERRSSLINLPKEAIIDTANKAVRLAKVGLSVVAGLLGLALVMVVLSLAGPVAARNQAREDLSDVGLMSAVTTVTVGADPTIIAVHIGTSTITATVKDASDNPVSDTFVIFTPTLGMGSIITNPYCYVEAEEESVVTRTSWTVISHTNASGGEYLESATVGDKLYYSFNGDSVAVIYAKHSDGGQFRVWIDGICSDTVDTYGSKPTQWGQQWVTDTASSGSYTLTVEVITPTVVCIDAFKSGTRTDSSGVATTTLTAGDKAGSCVITASADVSPTMIGTTTVTIIPGSPYTVTVAAHPPEIPADGYTSTIRAKVTDQWTNPVTDTTVVTFTTYYGLLMATQGKQVTDTTEGGVATAVFTSGLKTGTATITATTDSVTGTTHVIINPALPGSPYTLTLMAYPKTITADGTSTSAITATVKDPYGGNVTDDRTVTFTTTLGTISPLTNTTASGIATSTLTSEITADIATVKATADSVTGTTNVTFTAGSPNTVTVTAAPTSIPISGFTSIITAEVVDQYSNPVTDTTPVIFTTDLGILGSSTVTKTTANGVATAILTSENVTGTATITATADLKAETTTVRFIGPTGYLPTIRKNYTDARGANWDDGFQVQNLGTETADIIILYYTRDGAVVSTQGDTIAAHSSKTYYTDTLEVGDNFDGSVVIASDQAVAVIANQYVSSSSMWASYTGVPNGALKVNLPLVMRGNSGWDTAISVQNTGLATATVELAFHPGPGLPGNSDTITDTIPPGAARLYDQRRPHADLGPRFVGSAVVTSNEPVVAVVNETDGSILMSYSGFVGAGSTRVNVPLVMSQNSNWWTGVQVQNLGNLATDITITFYPDPAQSAITPTAQTVTGVASGASANFLQRGDQWTGKFVGSAVVTNSANQLMVAIVNELNEVDGEGMSYGGFTSGTTKISAPLVMYDNNDWYTGLQVQNIGASLAAVVLRVDGEWQASVGIPPGQSHTWYPIPWTKPSGFVGAATVESTNGRPLVGIVNEITQPYKAGENSMSYECFNEQ